MFDLSEQKLWEAGIGLTIFKFSNGYEFKEYGGEAYMKISSNMISTEKR